MATHFKWYGSNTNVTVPSNAIFTYPSQANKTVKSTPRLPPKNGGTFGPGRDIRIEIPAMGYMHGGNTTLAFDVTLNYTPTIGDSSIIRMQNNIQSIFNRVSLMYGSTPLEDIPEYGQIVRSMTEWTSTGDFDQGSISDGIGHSTLGLSGFVMTNVPNLDDTRPLNQYQKVNVRQAYIQGISLQKAGSLDRNKGLSGDGFGIVPYTPSDNIPTASPENFLTSKKISVTRRYVVQLNLGLMLQGKLLPVKYMASQLSLQLRLATSAEVIYWQQGFAYQDEVFQDNFASTAPTYEVTNVCLIPELLEFDSSYDQTFLEGLQQGVPLLFSSFNSYQFSSPGSTVTTLAIPERNRSIKSVFTVQKRVTSKPTTDSGATFYTTASVNNIITKNPDGTAGGDNDLRDVGSTLQEYQYRIGGRYFPASPVQCSQAVGSNTSNGGAEAYIELAKALNTMGDYRLSTPCNVLSWAVPTGVAYDHTSTKRIILPEYDGSYDVVAHLAGGLQLLSQVEAPGRSFQEVGDVDYPGADGQAGYVGRSGCGMNSCCFAMAINLETSNGMEISGLNAEEQSDISITMRWSHTQDSEMQFIVYTYYDAMMILFENNVVQLVK